MDEKQEFSRQESSFCIGSRAGGTFLLVRILVWLPNPSSKGKKKDCIAILKRSSIEYQQRRTIRALVDGTHRCRIRPLSLTASQLGRRSFGKRNFRWADSVFQNQLPPPGRKGCLRPVAYHEIFKPPTICKRMQTDAEKLSPSPAQVSISAPRRFTSFHIRDAPMTDGKGEHCDRFLTFSKNHQSNSLATFLDKDI